MISFDVAGAPQPQGSKTAFPRKGGGVVLVEGRRGPAREAFTSWREGIANEARSYKRTHDLGLVDTACAVRLQFRILRPRSVKPSKRPLPCVKPDLDKLARAALDAITHVLIADDALVVDLRATKVYTDDEPGVTIVVVDAMEGAA